MSQITQSTASCFEKVFNSAPCLVDDIQISRPILTLFISSILLCYTVSFYQREKLIFYANPKHQLIQNFLQKSDISKMVYQQFPFAITPFSQFLVYLTWNHLLKYFNKTDFEREIIKAADGGTLAVDWYTAEDDRLPEKSVKTGSTAAARPILLLCPGLNGGNINLYTHNLAKQAIAAGYKVGVLVFRCTGGLPITSYKLNCIQSWEDVRDVAEHVQKNYVLDKQTGKPFRQFYGYGVSLSANMMNFYAAHSGDKCVFDGICVLSCPFDLQGTQDWVYETQKFYSMRCGTVLNSTICRVAVPGLKKLVSKEEGEKLEKFFNENTEGVRPMEAQVFQQMYGYNGDMNQYYYDCTIKNFMKQIKCPTMMLSARDDQIFYCQEVPEDLAQDVQSNVIIAMTKKGNHACHLSGLFFPNTWHIKPIMAFYQFLEQNQSCNNAIIEFSGQKKAK